MKRGYCIKEGDSMKKQQTNMKKQILITMVALFTMVAIVGSSFAGDAAIKKNTAMGDEVKSQNVGKLTDDQKSQLKALHQKFIDETATQRASIISKHQEIRILMETTSPDKAKLHTLSAEVTELRRQVMDKKIDLALEAKKIAPDINFPMGFRGFSKHGMEMDESSMMGKCGGRGMMGGHGGMKGKGMGKMNCPAMNSQTDDTDESEDN